MLALPLRPCTFAIPALKYSEQGIVIKPVSVKLVQKFLVSQFVISKYIAGESFGCQLEQSTFCGNEFAVINKIY